MKRLSSINRESRTFKEIQKYHEYNNPTTKLKGNLDNYTFEDKYDAEDFQKEIAKQFGIKKSEIKYWKPRDLGSLGVEFLSDVPVDVLFEIPKGMSEDTEEEIQELYEMYR